MSRRRITLALAFSTGVLSFSACDSTDYETFTATLQGSQENPAVSSNGSGTAVVLLSRRGDRVDVSVSMTGLTNVTQAHIHRAPRGTNGGVIFWLYQPNNPLYPDLNQLRKEWRNPSTDSRDEPFSQRIIDDLRAGNLYVNFHTSTSPGGEIRGQLTPQ